MNRNQIIRLEDQIERVKTKSLSKRFENIRMEEADEFNEGRVSIYAPNIGRVKDALMSQDKFLVLYDTNEDLYRVHKEEELLRAVHLFFLNATPATEKRWREELHRIDIAVHNDIDYNGVSFSLYYKRYREYHEECLNRDIPPLRAVEFFAVRRECKRKLAKYKRIKTKVKILTAVTAVLMLIGFCGLIAKAIGPSADSQLAESGYTEEVISMSVNDLKRLTYGSVMEAITERYPYTFKFYTEKEVYKEMLSLNQKADIMSDIENGYMDHFYVKVVHKIK